MKEDQQACVFCKIVAGEAPASLVYRDDRVIVFPVLHPVNRGHLIVVPKKHLASFQDLDDATAAQVLIVAKKMAQAISKSNLKCEGINLFLADGEAAGQEVFHSHFHVYPRFSGDGFGFKYDRARHFIAAARSELHEVAEEIRRHLG